MRRACSRWISVSLISAAVVACGKPVDRSGHQAEFIKASIVGGPGPKAADRPLAADLAVEPVAMLVMFNRLQTPEKLQEALNMKAGRFSHLDLDSDGQADPLTVMKRDVTDGHAFEIRVKPKSGEYVVATMVFDPEWEYMGHYSGLKGGAASTQGQPLAAEPLPGAANGIAAGTPPVAPPTVPAVTPTPVPVVAPVVTPTPVPAVAAPAAGGAAAAAVAATP